QRNEIHRPFSRRAQDAFFFELLQDGFFGASHGANLSHGLASLEEDDRLPVPDLVQDLLQLRRCFCRRIGRHRGLLKKSTTGASSLILFAGPVDPYQRDAIPTSPTLLG